MIPIKNTQTSPHSSCEVESQTVGLLCLDDDGVGGDTCSPPDYTTVGRPGTPRFGGDVPPPSGHPGDSGLRRPAG